MANGDCVVGARHEAEIVALQEDNRRQDAVDKEQWDAINALRNRLPLWATLVISLLTGLLGFLATIAFR
jgi:hypothetical protein